MEKTLKVLKEQFELTEKEFAILENKRNKLKRDIIQEIFKLKISEKDFCGFVLLIGTDVLKYEKNIYASFVTMMVDKKFRQCYEELTKLIEDYYPVYSYHFSQEINDFATLVCNDFEYGIRFKENNPKKIKEFCEEYGIKIQIGREHDEIERIEQQIQNLTKTKEEFMYLKEIYGG